MNNFVIKEQHEMRKGRGPVALRLLERDRIQSLSNRWAHQNGQTLRGLLTPPAKTLIEWTRPYEGNTTLNEVAAILAKYHSFIYQLQFKKENDNFENNTYVAIKPTVKYEYPARFEVDGLLNVCLESKSQTIIRIQINIENIGKNNKNWYINWCYVSIWDSLEFCLYPGDEKNINLKEFEIEMDKIMIASGWDKEHYDYLLRMNGINADFSQHEASNVIADEIKEAFNTPEFKSPHSRKNAIEHVAKSYFEKGIGYSEYWIDEILHFVFMSREYVKLVSDELIVFTAASFPSGVRLTNVDEFCFRESPVKTFDRSQNVGGSTVFFDPLAYVHFVNTMIRARQTFIYEHSLRINDGAL